MLLRWPYLGHLIGGRNLVDLVHCLPCCAGGVHHDLQASSRQLSVPCNAHNVKQQRAALSVVPMRSAHLRKCVVLPAAVEGLHSRGGST